MRKDDQDGHQVHPTAAHEEGSTKAMLVGVAPAVGNRINTLMSIPRRTIPKFPDVKRAYDLLQQMRRSHPVASTVHPLSVSGDNIMQESNCSPAKMRFM